MARGEVHTPLLLRRQAIVEVADPGSVHRPGLLDEPVPGTAPVELAGRVALHGVLLFEEDRGERVEWQATTRKI